VLSGFITFEGIEGSGKTTQIGLLSEALKARGIAHVLTREPGGTPAGDRIRSLLLDPATRLSAPAELLLYAAARAEHLERVIRPALASGRTVLCDRYLDATRSYQGAGRGLPREWIETIHGLDPLRLDPDLTVLLDLDAAEGLRRARGRNARGQENEGRFEAEDLGFHRRVRDGYLALAKAEPARFRVVEASGTPEDVQKRVQEALCVFTK